MRELFKGTHTASWYHLRKEEELTRPRSNTPTKTDGSIAVSQSTNLETEDEFFSQQLKKLALNPEVERKLLNLKTFIFKNPGSHARLPQQPDSKQSNLYLTCLPLLFFPPFSSPQLSFSSFSFVRDDQVISLKSMAALRKHVFVQPTPGKLPTAPGGQNAETKDSSAPSRKLVGGKNQLKGQYGQDDSTSPMTKAENALFGLTTPTKTAPRKPETSSSSSHEEETMARHPSVIPAGILEGMAMPKPARRHRRVVSKDGKDLTLLNWRPEGTLVAHLVEHRGAVTQLAIARDYAFFVTGSDDGTVKVWDCQRLEKNVSNRSRLTYNPHGGKITALAFLENTHCIVVAGAAGAVHICKIECLSKENGIPKYGKCNLIQKFDLADGYVVAVDHFSQGDLSILVLVTSAGSIVAYDLKTGHLIWTLPLAASEGAITALMIDRDKNYLVVGTSAGCLACFDLRFGLKVRRWTTSKHGPVYQILQSPITQQSQCIFVASGGGHNEVSVWDLEKGICLKVFGLPEKEVKNWFADPARVEDTMAEYSSAKRPESTRAILSPSECPYLITAGTDLKIRLWDIKAPAKSYIVVGRSEQQQPVYRVTEQADVQFCTEDFVSVKPDAPPLTASASATNLSQSGSLSSSSSNLAGPGTTGLKKGLQVSLNHYDCVTCMGLTEVPYLMLLTTSRSGVIKVWK